MTVERLPDPRPKARDEALVVERVDDELLIYDLERDKAHCLNETAALVFEHCDGERDAAELAQLLDTDEETVRAAFVRLSDARLLEQRVPPAANGQWSRRQALRKIGFAGAAAGLGLPVVKSIVAPTQADAGSLLCGTPGQPCSILGVTGCSEGPPCCIENYDCRESSPGVCTCQD
jgi:coenzyme PQQ synthesis protein D (PqqD)